MFDFDEILSFGQLEFGQIWVFWLLPLPLLIMLLPPLKYRAESLYAPYFSRVLDIKKEKPSPGVRISRRNWVQMILMFLVWGGVIIALSSPQLVGEPQKQIKTARNFLLNVDLSLSMETRDWISNEGKRTSRWQAVQEVMSEFILFWVLAVLTIVSAIFAIALRNPINCAMGFIVSLAAMAGLFWLLDSRVISILQ